MWQIFGTLQKIWTLKPKHVEVDGRFLPSFECTCSKGEK